MSAYGIDLPSIVGAARQERTGQLQQQAMERAADRDARTEAALRAYQSGDKRPLQIVDPHLLQQLEQGGLETQLRQEQIGAQRAQVNATQQKSQQEIELNTARFAVNAAKAIKADPNRYQMIRAQAQQQAARGFIRQMDLPEQLTPDLMKTIDQMAQQSTDTINTLDPQKPQGDTNDYRDYQKAKEDPAYARFLEKQTKARGTQVNVGGPGSSPLTTASETAQQAEIFKADKRLQQLQNMRTAIDAAGGYEPFASYKAGTQSVLGNVASKLGIGGDKEFLKKRASAVAAIGGFTNPIISDLSGANVPETEMRRMRQSLPSPDDSAEELQAKIDAWEHNLAIIRNYGVDTLVKGVQTGKIKLPGEGGPQAGAGAPPPELVDALRRDAAAGDQRAAQALQEIEGAP